MKRMVTLTTLLFASVSIVIANGQNRAAVGRSFTATALDTTVDAELRNTLIKMENGQFNINDNKYLMELVKQSIRNAVVSSGENTNPKAFFQAGIKKAQILVSNLTAAYTRAIFKAQSAPEARKILARYRETIKTIVDFTRQDKFDL